MPVLHGLHGCACVECGLWPTHPGEPMLDAQGRQKSACRARCLGGLELHEHPARGTVNGHEQVAALGLIGHLRQVLHVQVHKARLIGRKRLVRRLGCLWPQRLELAHAMAVQTAMQPRARHIGVDERAHHRQQIVQREQQGLAQLHDDHLLCGCERRLQPMCRVGTVLEVGAVFPLEHRHGRHPVALCQRGDGLVAGGDFGSDARCGAGALVQSSDHVWNSPVSDRLAAAPRAQNLRQNAAREQVAVA